MQQRRNRPWLPDKKAPVWRHTGAFCFYFDSLKRLTSKR